MKNYFQNHEGFERECKTFDGQTVLENSAGVVIEFPGMGVPVQLTDVMADTRANLMILGNKVFIPAVQSEADDVDKKTLAADHRACMDKLAERS